MRLWFYVPDYVLVLRQLEEGYRWAEVSEHSAEPGRVRNCPNDADVIVVGTPQQIEAFRSWLLTSGIKDLRIEGVKV